MHDNNPMKKFVVIDLGANGCVIIRRPANLAPFEDKKNCLISPDLSEVDGISPHLWRIVDGAVIPRDGFEKMPKSNDDKMDSLDAIVFLEMGFLAKAFKTLKDLFK